MTHSEILNMVEDYLKGTSIQKLYALYGKTFEISDAVHSLEEITSDPQNVPLDRYRAVRALGSIGNADTIERLYQLFRTDEDSHLRELCTYSMILIDNKRGFELLLPEYRVSDEPWRVFLSRAFRLIRDDKIVPTLIALVIDPEPGIRSKAAYLLGRFRGKQVVMTLAKLLDDENWNVRAHAIGSLGLIKPENKRIVEGIIRKLDDPVNYVQHSAIFTLGQIGGPASKAALTTFLESHPPEEKFDLELNLGFSAQYYLDQINNQPSEE